MSTPLKMVVNLVEILFFVLEKIELQKNKINQVTPLNSKVNQSEGQKIRLPNRTTYQVEKSTQEQRREICSLEKL